MTENGACIFCGQIRVPDLKEIAEVGASEFLPVQLARAGIEVADHIATMHCRCGESIIYSNRIRQQGRGRKNVEKMMQGNEDLQPIAKSMVDAVADERIKKGSLQYGNNKIMIGATKNGIKVERTYTEKEGIES